MIVKYSANLDFFREDCRLFAALERRTKSGEGNVVKKVRLAEIASEAGVSVQHVSRILTGTGRAGEKTRERVLALACRMGYPDSPGGGNIAVLSPDGGLDDWNVLCMEILRENGKNGILFPFREFTSHDERYFEAAVYLNGVAPLEQVWYTNFRIPLIAVNQYGSALERIESVQPDADGEMRMAVEHLAKLGHRKIVRIRPVDFSTPKKNLVRGEKGFFGAAEEMGIREYVRNEMYEPLEKVREVIPRLLKEGFTAFIVVTDPHHRRILDIFRHCGKRIPEDVSLIVYELDLSPELGLTSIRIDNRNVVETGVRLLLEKLKGRPIPLQTILPGRLVIRKSTGRARS